MVGHENLDLGIGVRIPAPQQRKNLPQLDSQRYLVNNPREI